VMTGINLVSNGYVEEGMRVLKQELEKDPRSLDILLVIADFSEQLRQYPEAIDYRLKIEALDPWNGKNYLQMARLYRTVGDVEKTRGTLEKLFAFASTTPEGETAKKEFADLLKG